jgi:rare lipoprotein A
MTVHPRRSKFAMIVAIAFIEAIMLGSLAQASSPELTGARDPDSVSGRISPARIAVEAKPKLDLSGKRRVGKASFYARMFSGRKMADGNTMDPQKNNAASRTLPLGTIAMVTNLKTGKSAVVTIQDRGPYVAGRIVDLSPSTAHEIGITPREGVTKVEVAPLAVPQPDGRVKLGDAADDGMTLAALRP